MAHLLGAKLSLDSLLHDIKDIQDTLIEVSSRVGGQLFFLSWKFPDKLSININVEELLTNYQYQEGDDEMNEVSHIMLYDLIIDRLLFLLQCFTYYNELLLDSKMDHLKRENSKRLKSISAGLTAKKCWSRMNQVALRLQQFAQMGQKAKFKSGELSSKVLSTQQTTNFSNKQEASEVISTDILNRSCQTDETIYVPCELCSRTQSCLVEVGKSVVKLCKSQALPTSLEDYISHQSNSNLFSVAELTRWKNLQAKDLSRVNRQMESQIKQIKPLKEELSTAVRKQEQFKSELEEAKTNMERRQVELIDQHRLQERKHIEMQKVLQNQIASLESDKRNLSNNVTSLSAQLTQLQNEVLEKHKTLRTVENEKCILKDELVECRQYQQDAIRLQAEIVESCRKLQTLEEKLRLTNSLLEKEQTVNKTMHSHEEALQIKQKTLLHRFEEINEECDKLREQASLAEDEKERLLEELQYEKQKFSKKNEVLKENKKSSTAMEKENAFLHEKVVYMEKHIEALESELRDKIDRERLLVSYPDLQKSYNIQLIENSGDVYIDMQRQVKANQVRIDVLQEENSNLLKTLTKFPTVQKPNIKLNKDHDTTSKTPQIQLWNDSSKSDVPTLNEHHFQTYLSGSPKQNRMLSQKKHSANVAARKPNQQQIQPNRTSFSIGPGKRPTSTPASSRPSSGRSALLKPWT